MTRRRLFALATLTVAVATAAAPVQPPAARELTADQQVLQALNRLTFGPRPGDVERVRAAGVDRWIDEQLHPERIADASADAFVARFPVLAMSGAELLREFPPPGVVLAQTARATGAGRAGRAGGRRDSAVSDLGRRFDEAARRRRANRTVSPASCRRRRWRAPSRASGSCRK